MPVPGGRQGRDAHGRFVSTRSLRPADSTAPLDDTHLTNGTTDTPETVGLDVWTAPGETPPAITLADSGGPAPPWPPSRVHVSPWDGWPGDWQTPAWGGRVEDLTDVAWTALDLNASVFASMPPYLVGNSATLPDEWLANPDPAQYTSWATFAHGLMWDYQLGEAFVICTARYANGWPARFHLAPPWSVSVDYGRDGLRDYSIGGLSLPREDVLHIRYKSVVGNARGVGPLDASGARLVAARVLLRYLTNFVAGGAIPSSVLESEDDLTAKQAADLHDQWLIARMSKLGLPAVLSGGVTWKATQANALDSALAELAAYTEAKLATALGVPPFLLGLPSGGDSMTYSNVSSIFDYHWRAGLRPKASRLMLALTQWLVPRGTTLEVNRDEYVRPGPLERAQTWEIYLRNGVVTIDEVREAERFGFASTTADSILSGALK